MSTRFAVLCSWVVVAVAVAGCDSAADGPDGSIERDAAVSDGGGLLDGGAGDGGAIWDAGPPDAGPLCDTLACDPRDALSCGGAAYCSLGSGYPECTDATMPGLLTSGDACSDTAACSPGLECFKTADGGTCARPCCPGEMTGCAVGSRCAGSGVLVDGVATDWGRCLELRSCEVLRPEICEDREGCYLIGGTLMTECRIAGMGDAGDPCRVQEDCDAGFFCGGIGALLQCVRLCEVETTEESCPVDEGNCVQQAHTPPGVGLCTMDAMSARMYDR